MTFQIKKATVVEPARFWANVDISGGPDACWPWLLSRPTGYGYMRTKAGRLRANRIAYRLAHGPLIDGLEICHTCDNPACVNPAHLFQATHRENMRDRKRKGRGGYLKGEANGRAKLTAHEVRAIRRRADRGESMRSISRAFGVTDVMVGRIARRLAWMHVTEVEA